MNRQQWKAAYRQLRCWQSGHCNERQYWDAMRRMGFKVDDSLLVIRIWCHRSPLYHMDTTARARERITRKSDYRWPVRRRA